MQKYTVTSGVMKFSMLKKDTASVDITKSIVFYHTSNVGSYVLHCGMVIDMYH